MIPNFTTKTIGIIGGKGGMGRWFEIFFRKAGFPVLISDVDTILSNEELVSKSDVVILSTPISVTPGLARELGPFFTEKQLLADFTSLKSEVMEAMLSSSPSAVLGLHPLFGPHTQGISGQNMILVPGRGDEWFTAFEELFEKNGCMVHSMTAEAHDVHMTFVQGIPHFLSIALGVYMQKKGLNAETVYRIATPTSKVNVNLMGRLFAFDLELYEDLIAKNPYMEKSVEDFVSVLDESSAMFFHGDKFGRKQWLQDIRGFLGAFPDKALQESNRILDALSHGKDASFS